MKQVLVIKNERSSAKKIVSGLTQEALTEVAAEKGMIGQAETKKLQEWRKNPANEAWITA